MRMIEKVARAICAEHGYRAPYIDTTWHKYEAHARSAIQAMRQPSRDMKDAVRLVGGVEALAYGLASWPTMIDAALSETPNAND